MNIEQLNMLDDDGAFNWFMQMCTSSTWCQSMVKARPFDSAQHLQQMAETIWHDCNAEDVKEALAGHPMIGDMATLRAKYAHTKTLAKGEQSGVDSASDEVLEALRALNYAYLERHGFIFIICASGLSAEHMLAQIERRIDNDTAQEFATAASEQLKITRLRIDKALAAESLQAQ